MTQNKIRTPFNFVEMNTKILFFYSISIFTIILFPSTVFGQKLKSGFNSTEYRDMLLIAEFTNNLDSTKLSGLTHPADYKKIYRSEPMGLDHLWELWMRDDGVAVISIRGTTPKTESWLANYYVAMIPAEGSLVLSRDNTINYKVAENPKAAVHTGWMIGMASLSIDILPRIDSLYQTGTRHFMITGHSQGGAISFLLNAHLQHLQKQEMLPSGIRFKTYSSAAPKPGNLFFAYDYEMMNHNGWAFNVVNTADWVPETPLTVQTIYNFNEINPFKNARKGIRSQKFPRRLYLMHAYKRLYKPAERTRKNYEKYLGRAISKQIKNFMPEFVPPEYYETINYSRAGHTIVLKPTGEYDKIFPDDQENIYAHHLPKNYLFLIDEYYPKK
ncbi:MAG: lipase family protein [Bacteroidota bacterium]